MTTYKVWNGTSWVYIDSQNYDARYVLQSSKGSNSGVASLDSSGHIPSEQLPSSIVGAVSYKGTFDPTSGAPTPAAQGYYYVASGTGTISATTFATGDWLVYTDESAWDKLENSSASVTWSNVSDKPASYTPDTHDNTSHSVEYITVGGVTYEALLANDDIGTGATQVAAGNHTHSGYQPLDGDLTSIAGVAGSAGLLRKTASNTWSLDTNTYLTELSTVGNATNWDTASRPTFTGNALKVLRLNATGDAFEFATVSTDGDYASKTESDLTLYVYEDATGDADGSSKANAYTTLQAAIDAIPDVAQNVTVIVCKGSTNYLGQTTTIQKASVKSLTIRGEFYAYEACDANAVAGKVVDASADFSDFEVGDRVVCTKYSGTVGESGIKDYFYATITEVGSGYIQTSEETKVPTTGWKYLINQTVFDGNVSSRVITLQDTMCKVLGVTFENSTSTPVLKSGTASSLSLEKIIVRSSRGIFVSSAMGLYVLNSAFISMSVETPIFDVYSGLATAEASIYNCIFDFASASSKSVYSRLASAINLVYCGFFSGTSAAYCDSPNSKIYLKSCYIASTVTYGTYGYNITLVDCTNNATTPVYNLTSGGSIAQWNLFDLPTTTGNGDKYLKLNSGATAFEFATVSATVDIHGTDSTSEFTTGDEVLIYDSSLGENRKILRGNFFNGLEGDYISIHGTFEETTPTSSMEVLVYDPSVPANRRMTRANFLDGISAVGTFTDLTDTPTNYTDAASKFVKVNATGDALEFATISSSFIDLTDTPASYEGCDETYYVRVNATSNALEFATVPSSYTLPTASADVLGGVKIGSGIDITDGVISASGGDALPSQDGNNGKFLTTDGTNASWMELPSTTFASGDAVVTLPENPSAGQVYQYVGTGVAWTINANTGQTIRSLGDTGNQLTSGHNYASVALICIGTDVWSIYSSYGTVNLVTV